MIRQTCIRQWALVGSLLAYPGTACAHEKWFLDAVPYQTHWESALQFPGIVGVGATVALTVLAGFMWRARGPRPDPRARSPGRHGGGASQFYALVPLILGIHVGLPLLVLAVKSELF